MSGVKEKPFRFNAEVVSIANGYVVKLEGNRYFGLVNDPDADLEQFMREAFDKQFEKFKAGLNHE